MRISVLPVSFFQELKSGKMTLRECAEIVAEAGAEGLDVSPVFLGGASAGEVRRSRLAVEAVGLEIVMLVAYSDFTHPDHSVRQREFEQLLNLIPIAADLGAGYLRLTAGQAHPETGREEGVRWAAEGMTAAVDAAERYGVQLVFENHSKPSVWALYDFAYPADIFLEIAHRTEGSDLGILFDTANPVSRGDNPLDVLNPVIDRVRYVHASDTRAAAEGFEPVLLGTGAVPFGEIFSRLKQNGYDGWISVEEVSRMGRDGVRKAVAFVKNTWESING